MNCEMFREYLDNYENLTAEEKLEMTLHTQTCEKCRMELDFMLSIIETTKSLPKIEPPADFMDKLNIRIDMEERKKRQLAKRILNNLQRNWKQYAAAAACFALVAVVTSNGKMLVDKMHSNDGVIQEETVTTGDSAPQTPVSTTAPQTSDVISAENKTENLSPVEGTVIPTADKSEKASNTPAPKASNSKPSVSQPVQTAKAAESKSSAVTSDGAVSTPVQSETESNISSDTVAEQTAPPSENYGIAVASITPEVEIATYSADAAEYSAKSARSGYSLADESDNIAYGRYYNVGNEGETDKPKAIGKLKISSADAQKAMDVIQQYSIDRSGDLYMTDSANFVLILSSFSKEGVRYTDYTMNNDGIIKFMIDFN